MIKIIIVILEIIINIIAIPAYWILQFGVYMGLALFIIPQLPFYFVIWLWKKRPVNWSRHD